MPVTLNFTTIRDCDSTTGVTSSGQLTAIADSDLTQQQGTSCVECGSNAANGSGDVTATLATGSFDSEVNDVSCWYLNPGDNDAGAQVLRDVDNSVQLWLSDGTVTAYYNQGGGSGAPNPLRGGWNLLRCNGSATPDATVGGTWGSAQAQAVTSVGVRILNAAVNDGKNDTAHGFDWFKYHDKILITGDDAGSPWNMERIAEISRTIGLGGGNWGLVNQTDILFEMFAGLEVDNDGATDGRLVVENRNLTFDQLGPLGEYALSVLDGGQATFGLKDADGASGTVYAVNGCVLKAALGNPPITVASGGILNLYGSRLQGWGVQNLGSGGGGQVEVINCDIYLNTAKEFRTTNLLADNVRLHQPIAAKADLGGIYTVPV